VPVKIEGATSKQTTDGKYFLNIFKTKAGEMYVIKDITE
jgi:hypothetical protein